MEQLKKSLIQINKSELIQKLISTEYAFAAWRLPEEKESKLIVSLSGSAQSKSQLNSMDQGFLFNKFEHAHPVNPYHIKADLIFDEILHVDPRVNSKQLDEFNDAIKSAGNLQAVKPQQASGKTLSGFEAIVEEAVNEIKNSELDKVVISRFKVIELPEEFSPYEFFNRLCISYPNAFCSLVYLPGEGIWIGASPELLISDDNKRFKTAALAGTKSLEADQSLSEIAWTQKEIEEQAFVSRYIINCFKKIRLREFEEYGPKTIQAGSLAHLKTVFEVDYNHVQFDDLANQMLDLLHPTSAVCGMPLEQAKAFISKKENYDRSFYSGFSGPVNFDGSTDLFVNLRCMQLTGNKAKFFAGAGITEDSNPQHEMMETELKMETLLSLISK